MWSERLSDETSNCFPAAPSPPFFFSYLSDNAKSVFLCVCVIPFAGSVFFFPTRTKKDNRPAALKIPVGSAGLAVKAHYLSLNAER